MALAIYSGVAAKLSGETLVRAPSATIEVRREDTAALASIFSDEDGLVAITNPSAFTDSKGNFSFYAEGLERGYKITVTDGAFSLVLRNQAVGTAQQFDFSDPVTTKGDLVVGGASGTKVRKGVGTDGHVLTAEAAQTDGLTWKAVPLPRSYLAGFTLSNNGTDATNDIDIAAGAARDSTNAENLIGTAMTKRLDANWAAGTGQGMRNSAAAITDTTYHIYAVAKALGADPDYYAHTSATAATVLAALQAETGGADYLYVRRIGSIIRASAAIVAFSQWGDEFLRNAAVLDVDDDNPGTSAVTRAVSVPTGIKVDARLHVTVVGASNTTLAYISPLDVSDQAPSATAAPLSNGGGTNTSGTVTTGVEVRCRTNTSAQVRSRLSASGVSDVLRIATLGWVDTRGRDD